MRLRGLGAARHFARWAASRFHRGPMILGYHRVADVAWDPQQLCVSPKNFSDHLEVIAARAEPVTLPELVERISGNRRVERCFAVTLDDGYADTCEEAAPRLARYSIPATVFVTTAVIGKRFWWCEIEDLVATVGALPKRIVLDVAGVPFEWHREADTLRSRARLVHALGDLFRALPFEDHAEALAQVKARFEPGAARRLPVGAISAGQIASLASSELIDIGSHMVTHTSLNRLDVPAQRRELEKSKADLEALCGRAVIACSYPNGRYRAETPALAAEAGYSAACASHQQLVAPGADPMILPRLWVGDWDRDRFSRWLDAWLR